MPRIWNESSASKETGKRVVIVGYERIEGSLEQQTLSGVCCLALTLTLPILPSRIRRAGTRRRSGPKTLPSTNFSPLRTALFALFCILSKAKGCLAPKNLTAKEPTLKDLKVAFDKLRWVCKYAMEIGILPEHLHPLTGSPVSVVPLTWFQRVQSARTEA